MANIARCVPILLAMIPIIGRGMEIQWTRMAGQWPVEASPLVADFTGSRKSEILVLNRGGQLMLWTGEGIAIGSGQDGTVAQLPPGRWTTAPTLLAPQGATRLIVTSVEGLVVGLDSKFQLLWQHKLLGETAWGRATPAMLRTSSGSAFAFGDGSGTIMCLTSEGKVLWTNALGAGAIKASPQKFSSKQGAEQLLVAGGSMLFCLDEAGKVRWRRDLGKEIVTRPEVLSLPREHRISCGTASGSLFSLSVKGKILWECRIGDTLNNGITFLPRRNSSPLILCTGLWGNLHAINVEGRCVWSHLFRSKNRAAPLVLETGEGHRQIFLPTFHQHVYAFNENGGLADDLRLSGIMPSSLTPISGPTPGRTDLLVTTTALLAYRLRPGPPKSPYGKTGEPQNVSLDPPAFDDYRETPTLEIENPHGALINVELSMTDPKHWKRILGVLSARSAFEIPLPTLVRTGSWSLRATAKDAAGNRLQERTWQLPPPPRSKPRVVGADILRAWATEPYGAFRENRSWPLDYEAEPGREHEVALQNLYEDETDQAAFIIGSTKYEPVQARVTWATPTNKAGQAFAGTIVLREVVSTGSVNGETVPDALPKLNHAGLVTISPHHSMKIWVKVDAHGAAPGNYKGLIAISPLNDAAKKIELPLRIEVLNLRLPKDPSLSLCAWDYVPNRWFPAARATETLDDMSHHGVNVFPRSTIPPGRADAAGQLTIEWSTLDAELERLQGRGRILFHLGHPPIEFAAQKSAEEKRPIELAYIHQFRDHLRDRGRGYEDYAFYLLDEPGLDYGTNVPVLLDGGALFREADPGLRTYADPVPGLSWKDFLRIEPLVDIWAPNMRLVSGLLSGDPRIKRIMSAKTVWSYECVAQVKSLSPLRYNRANAWRAKFFGLRGIGFWTHSPTEVDHWYAGKTVNDEFALVYPGELPVPSVRWEAVRDGLEDVSAIALLEQAIERCTGSGAKIKLVEQAQEVLRIALRDIMEMSDEAFVESRDFLREGDRTLHHTWTDMETFRRHRAEIARLTVALGAE